MRGLGTKTNNMTLADLAYQIQQLPPDKQEVVAMFVDGFGNIYYLDNIEMVQDNDNAGSIHDEIEILENDFIITE